MQALAYKEYAASVEFDDADKIFVGRVVGIDDIVGFHAETMPELEAAFHEAVDDYLRVREAIRS